MIAHGGGGIRSTVGTMKGLFSQRSSVGTYVGFHTFFRQQFVFHAVVGATQEARIKSFDDGRTAED